MNSSEVAVMGAGSVEYALEEAAVPIADLIEALIEASEDGATHVVGASGNYRGAQWVRLGTELGRADEE